MHPTSNERFLLFAGDQYYPAGGWSDFVGGFTTIDDAAAKAPVEPYSWWHVVDVMSGEIVRNVEVLTGGTLREVLPE